MEALFANVPPGSVPIAAISSSLSPSSVGCSRHGASWAVANGYGTETDLEHIEEGGCLPGADPDEVSARALERGRPQLGTLGFRQPLREILPIRLGDL